MMVATTKPSIHGAAADVESPLSPELMRVHIEALLSRRKNYLQEVKDIVACHEFVVFYGCGAILNSIVETWDTHVGRKIDFVCDSDREKWGHVFCGATCLSPQELLAIKHRCAVFVTIGDFKPVFEWLKQNDFISVNQIFKYDLETSNYLATASIGTIADNLVSTYNLLSDRHSVSVFNAILNRIFCSQEDIDVMARVCDNNQYFPSEIIQLQADETFLDVGGYDGDTLRDFVSRTSGHFSRIYVFEVDRHNFDRLRDNVSLLPCSDRISIYNLGAWDSECDISYSIGHSQSTVGIGEGHGHVARLDDILCNEKISFIKMDIEGAELRALVGAQGIISSQRPRLAICIYHKFSHLWEIPLYVHSIMPECKIYLRHYTTLEYETVCYAVS
ncbi:MAG: FkbM family methyltransferase [Deltaproteobacteria bacterium]|nr:FkbM family methyltransferase [Deltaproteobacteria bacterium]